jgi:putative ABC transport system substrate-binding protein
MKEKSFLTKNLLLVLILLASALTLFWSCQQQPKVKKKNYLIGMINPNTASQDINKGFIQKLKKNGFIEGDNTTYLKYDSNFELDKIIQDMVARNVDLIFTVTTPATRKTKKATQANNIPVVFVMQDPVASGIIKSLAHPDSNLTGIQIRGSIPKTLEWMLAVSPGIKNLFVPIKYDTKAAEQSLKDLQTSASTLGVNLSLAEVNDQPELDTALKTIPHDVDGIFMIHSIFIHSNADKLVQAAIDKKLLIGSAAAHSDRGVTVSYGMIAEKTGQQAGRLAAMILQGKKTTDIPSEITDFFFGINLQTAEATNVEISADILQQADIIIR